MSSGSSWHIAFVVPRYGPEIVGGAETLARAFAEHLPPRFRVEVLTTCAVDHHSWRNVRPAGETRVGGVTVRRFPVSPRDVESFLSIQERISAGLPVSLEEEILWARGSVNSEDLYDFIAAREAAYDALVFLPYLFGTTLLGTQVAPERSLVVPCLHDEGYAYTRLVKHLFRSVRGLVFNSEPERALAERLYGVGGNDPVVGMGFDIPAPLDGAGAAFRERHGLGGDYLLYFGRKEGGKNLPYLLDCFRACGERDGGLNLVVAGDGRLDPSLAAEGVIDLPRLEEEEKRAACSQALALCQPSTNESFSIVIMESWLEGRPVLVHAGCDVTREHVRRSNGGLYFASPAEFAAEVGYLRERRREAAELGRLGREYVATRYSWERVTERLERALRFHLGER